MTAVNISRSSRDALVIETLAESEAELREHNASLQADVAVYRDLLQTALGQLHDANLAADRWHARILALIGGLRSARKEIRELGVQLRTWQEHAA
jgi:hypothetical protein